MRNWSRFSRIPATTPILDLGTLTSSNCLNRPILSVRVRSTTCKLNFTTCKLNLQSYMPLSTPKPGHISNYNSQSKPASPSWKNKQTIKTCPPSNSTRKQPKYRYNSTAKPHKNRWESQYSPHKCRDSNSPYKMLTKTSWSRDKVPKRKHNKSRKK